MRLSRKITTYGKELYNWNFFKTMKGYKLNPSGNWDSLTRVSFGFFDNEPNTKLSENISDLQIYILKASDCNFDNMPIYYDQGPTSTKLKWPDETSTNYYIKSRSDYDKIQDNYLYKIEIVGNEELMITGTSENRNLRESQYLDLSRIDLPTDECLHYQIIICTLEYLNNVNSGCYTPTSIFNGQYYSAYANTIFVDNNVSTEHCFRSWVSSTQDYELQMLSYSNEIQYIPTKEMVVYNTITNVAEYSGRIRYELPNGEDIFCVATQTEPNKGWYYAYNISKAETPDGISGGKTNSGFTTSTKLQAGGFKPWFTIKITNPNSSFSVSLTLNNTKYEFLYKIKFSDLCNKSTSSTDISIAFTPEDETSNEKDPEDVQIYKSISGQPDLDGYYRNCFCTFKTLDSDDELIDTPLKYTEYSRWSRNELIPTIDENSNCTIPKIYNPVFDIKKNTQYYYYKDNDPSKEKITYPVRTEDFQITNLMGDFDLFTEKWTSQYGCMLMFENIRDESEEGDLKVFVLAGNKNGEKIAGSSIFNNDISKTKYTMPTSDYPEENGKIEGDNVYSPVNYITGDSPQPNPQNGGN